MNDDVEDAKAITDGLAAYAAARTFERLGRLADPFARYRPLTIHRYHPADELGGALGILDLARGRIEELIRRGEQDADAPRLRGERLRAAAPGAAGGGGAGRGVSGGRPENGPSVVAFEHEGLELGRSEVAQG